MRFCSRCGLALTGLAEWLAGGGVPVRRPDQAQPSELTLRRKHMRRAAKLMFFSGVLFPVFLIFCAAIEEGAPMIVPVGTFFVALVWMLYARIFIDKTTPAISQVAQPRGVRVNPSARLVTSGSSQSHAKHRTAASENKRVGPAIKRH